MFGSFFLLTQYLQLVHGYTALGAGVRSLPFALTMMVVAPLSPRLAEHIGTRGTVCTGLVVAGAGMFLFSRAGVDSSYLFIAVTLIVLASGMGLTMAPSTASIMSSLPLAKAGVGSAMNDTTRELGGALGVAVLGSLLAGRYTHELTATVASLPSASRDLALASLGGALQVADGLGATGTNLAAAGRAAFVHAMRVTLEVAGVVAWIAAVIVARVLPRRVAPSEVQPRTGVREVDA